MLAVVAPLGAQTNTFAPGAQVNSPSLTGFSTDGSEMVGMALTLNVAGGGVLNTSWINDGNGFCGGTFANGFSVSMGCTDDSFSSTWTVNNNSNDRINSLRFNGAPGRTIFDCGWNGNGCENTGTGAVFGTDGSANGRSMTTVAGGTYGGGISGFYANAVGLNGNAPIGDLFEQLTIQFDAVLGAGDTYLFSADTDNSSFDAPPPTVVPEPSTYALMFSGLVGIGLMARRRRNV